MESLKWFASIVLAIAGLAFFGSLGATIIGLVVTVGAFVAIVLVIYCIAVFIKQWWEYDKDQP